MEMRVLPAPDVAALRAIAAAAWDFEEFRAWWCAAYDDDAYEEPWAALEPAGHEVADALEARLIRALRAARAAELGEGWD